MHCVKNFALGIILRTFENYPAADSSQAIPDFPRRKINRSFSPKYKPLPHSRSQPAPQMIFGACRPPKSASRLPQLASGSANTSEDI